VTPSTLVVGLGNPILGDDGVGWRVAEEVRRRLPSLFQGNGLGMRVEVDCLSLGGLSLMERLIGYDHAVIIDAVNTNQPPGTVSCFRLEDLPDLFGAHTGAAHDTSLQSALRLGRTLGAHLPRPGEILVVGVNAQTGYEFSEALTPPVAAAVPVAARRVLEVLEAKSHGIP
jgi:hydrogenase maturation protease